MRRRTRMEYHKAIRYIKKNKNKMIRDKVARSLNDANSNQFWTNISKLKSSKDNNNDVIDGKTGIDACNIFKSKYEKLYNNTNRDNELGGIVAQTYEQMNCQCIGVGNSSCHLHSVTVKHVSDAIKKLRSGQLDDNTCLISDCLIYGTHRLYAMLSFLFTIMIRHGYSLYAFNNTTIKPIVKDKRKLCTDSENYRAIAPNGSFAKLLDYVIINSFPNIFNTSDQQFAYKASFSTTMCTFMVIETIQYYRENGSNVYTTLLDCSKAFDLVRFDKLFNLLLRKNLCPLIIRLLINIYLHSKYCIRWNNVCSDQFDVNNGVKQGGVMSPLLFTLYTDPLIENLKSSRLGCYVGDKCASVFVYADDIILLSPTKCAMQKLLDRCSIYANDFGLKFNPIKCKNLIFGDGIMMDQPLKIGDAALSVVTSEKHLGHLLSSNGDYVQFDSMIKDIKVRGNCLKREFHYLDNAAKCKLFNAHCTSFYGS